MVSSYAWSANDFPHQSGSISIRFETSVDTPLMVIRSDDAVLMSVAVRHAALWVESPSNEPPIELDIEDTFGVGLGGRHDLTLTFGEFGTRVYLDGYQCFANATNLVPARYAEQGIIETAEGVVSNMTIHDEALNSEWIAASTVSPIADVEFAAAYLAGHDLRRIEKLSAGTIYACFRVRGMNQFGTIVAAANEQGEAMNVSIDDEGFTYRILVDGEWAIYHAAGLWNDGGFHDLAIRAFRGAIDIYVDGYLQLHQPGQFFLDTLNGLTKFSIGEDTSGSRLYGEVRNGGIFGYALTDGQIKALAGVEPTTDTAIFDKGYEGSASYRIPSLITTASGVLIAGADQRVTISNDSPNEIHFVIRRSLDGGATWLPMQTVIAYPGKGLNGASTIDSCLVADRETGRVTVLIDHFPGGVGFANAERAMGVDAEGRFVLHDTNGAQYLLQEDGSVTDLEGVATQYRVDDKGNVTQGDKPRGNIYLKSGIDPHESLLTQRTSYLVEVHSDDDGETWSAPRVISHMVKEEWMGFLGVSPGNGIQLSQGHHKGRLLIPYYLTGDSAKYNAGGALYSDDHGETWHRGMSINEGRINDGRIIDERHIDRDEDTTHESVFIERANGDVVVFFRNQHPCGHVGRAISHDGGQTWDEVKFDPVIPEIFCQPNAVMMPDPTRKDWRIGEASDTVVFANASMMRPYRGCGVLRLSHDGGNTWDVNRCFNPYHYVYQCMSVLPDHSLGLLWERETAGLYFTILPSQWFGKNAL